uniref:Uncharacterized protein n=1 Tax=viral metagenome TaxID=1070528 RepID=A0A6M3IFC9_9ZZZZ
MPYEDFRDNVKIDKRVIITIDEEAVDVLGNVCELARRHIAKARTSARTVDEYDARTSQDIENFLIHIFDNT